MRTVATRAKPSRATSKRPTRREPRTRLDVDERRSQLVELGLEHFGGRAYDDVSIDAIAEAAGISKGLLYHYFPTKRAYYAATVREAAARLVACTETPPGAPSLARLHDGLDAYLSYVRAHAKAYATLMRSGVGVDPEIARIVDETRARFIDRLTEGFADAAPLSARASPLDTPLVRLALRGWVGFAEAASLGWTEAIAGGETAPAQDEVRDLLAKTLMQIFAYAASGADGESASVSRAKK